MKRSDKLLIKELDELLASYCEGHLNDEGKRRLAALLESSREARRYYLHYLDLHMDLVRRVFEHRMPANPLSRPSDGLFNHWLRAAAVFLLAAIAWIVWWQLRDPAGGSPHPDPSPGNIRAAAPFAFIGNAQDAAWNAPTSPAVGSLLGPTALELFRGRLRLDFFNGAALTIEAPASLALETIDRIALHRGKIAARIPNGDLSFTVEAPQAVLVNMGTEFAVTVDDEGRSLVHVLKGEVAVSLLGPGATTSKERSAEEGESLIIDPQVKAIRSLVLDDLARFTTTLEAAPIPLRVTPAYVAAVKASRPLGYWRFEKFQRQRLIPNEMGPRHPVRTRTPLQLEGEENRCVRFAPDQPDVVLMTKEGFDGIHADGEYTLELWMNPASHHWAGLAALVRPDETVNPAKEYDKQKDRRQLPEPCIMALECMPARESKCWLAHEPRAIRFFHRWPAEDWKHGSTNTFTTKPYTPGQWHHLVAVREKDKLSLYHNAELERRVRVEPHQDDETYHLLIGRCSITASNGKFGSRAFSGRIDEVALYDRALTADEVRRHFELIALR